ncbi:MAG: hypothetical protein ACOY35_03305 [Bacillota bacterium]
MKLFDKDLLERYSFSDGIRIGDYESNRTLTDKIPNKKGIYIVLSKKLPKKLFLEVGTGGFFKGKNPNVDESFMLRNWVNNTHILYIGKAGGKNTNGTTSNSTLRERIIAYLKFGQGENIGHWGGRLIWQLQYYRDLHIYWRTCSDSENPVEMEKIMIREFENKYGKLPFANLRH